LSSTPIALITFVCTFGGALLAISVRAALPPSHVSKESQDVVRLGMGLVATMTALLLGLVTASAKGSFDAQDAAVKTAAANIMTLDRHLARYGPETKRVRDELHDIVAARIETTWGRKSPKRTMAETTVLAEAIENQILALAPGTEAQRWFKGQALDLAEDVLRTRWRVLESVSGSDATTFMPVVIAWLTLTFLSFGLFAPRNATVLVSLLAASLSVAAAVYLLLELGTPYSGSIMVSSAPLRYALTHLGQ
jgi:hypothetical protein